MPEAFIVAAARTAGARKGGRLSGWHPADLAAEVLNALLDRVDADPALIEDVILGCVSQVGEQSTNIARKCGARLAPCRSRCRPPRSTDSAALHNRALHFAAQGGDERQHGHRDGRGCREHGAACPWACRTSCR